MGRVGSCLRPLQGGEGGHRFFPCWRYIPWAWGGGGGLSQSACAQSCTDSFSNPFPIPSFHISTYKIQGIPNLSALQRCQRQTLSCSRLCVKECDKMSTHT